MNSEATLKKFNGDCGMGCLFADSYNIALVDFLKNVLMVSVVWFVRHLNRSSDDEVSTVIGSLPSSPWSALPFHNQRRDYRRCNARHVRMWAERRRYLTELFDVV